MASLERSAASLGTLAAAHVALKLVNWCSFLPPDDVERDCLVRVAAEALHLEIAIAGVEGVTEGGGRLCGPLERKHAGIPRLAGQAVGILSRVSSALCQYPDGSAEQVLTRLRAHAPIHARETRDWQIVNPLGAGTRAGYCASWVWTGLTLTLSSLRARAQCVRTSKVPRY